jgi:hypothetical protein
MLLLHRSHQKAELLPEIQPWLTWLSQCLQLVAMSRSRSGEASPIVLASILLPHHGWGSLETPEEATSTLQAGGLQPLSQPSTARRGLTFLGRSRKRFDRRKKLPVQIEKTGG